MVQITKGPFSAPRDPKSYTTTKKAIIPERQQDWAYARAQYEAGIKTVRLIADEIGVSTPAVYARSGNEGWTRDAAGVAKHAVEVRASIEVAKTEKLEVERVRAERVNAEMQAQILVKHRTDIHRARAITMRLFKELEDVMDSLPDLEHLGELLRSENERGQDKLNDVYRAILALPDRVDVNKKLSEALKVQLQLERQAFGIVGALEDPEAPTAPQVGQSDIDKILGKFDLVIRKKSPPNLNSSSEQVLGEIIDVSPGN
jgi:hypothetical protein